MINLKPTNMDKEKLFSIDIIVMALAFIVFGVLLRMQNLAIASLTQSVATLSSIVHVDVRDRIHAGIPPARAGQPEEIPAVAAPPSVGMANPASVNCQQKGGQLEMREGPLGQYGVCLFEDNRQCEEWALFRGSCPAGGLKITGYTSDATVYCAITGHQAVESDKPGEVGSCTVDGVTCSAQEFYEQGTCAPAAP